ncbi:hypothetical protein N5079_16330 [Planotetraspora sp. A-T 1434]|uniref:hypothetical protein n=1 Tax=Planotetraspora sp. A-T 1434 TaxID=2979219 RepID=UPI0021C0C254|nr:hypothetical protein [Planotetraspora sp. A-T 1434]MCT9931780.1 hypothetical protein [Planotetraspora sp. A-T 1434]
MKRVVIGAATLAGAGVAMARWLASRHRPPTPVKDPQEHTRWLGVTINRQPEDISRQGRLPQPLAGLDVEVRMNKAPGDRGTELYARPREPMPIGAAAVMARLRGDDPRQMVRKALREAKCIIETGELLEPDRPFATTRPTIPGRVLDVAIGRAPGEGRL